MPVVGDPPDEAGIGLVPACGIAPLDRDRPEVRLHGQIPGLVAVGAAGPAEVTHFPPQPRLDDARSFHDLELEPVEHLPVGLEAPPAQVGLARHRAQFAVPAVGGEVGRAAVCGDVGRHGRLHVGIGQEPADAQGPAVAEDRRPPGNEPGLVLAEIEGFALRTGVPGQPRCRQARPMEVHDLGAGRVPGVGHRVAPDLEHAAAIEDLEFGPVQEAPGLQIRLRATTRPDVLQGGTGALSGIDEFRIDVDDPPPTRPLQERIDVHPVVEIAVVEAQHDPPLARKRARRLFVVDLVERRRPVAGRDESLDLPREQRQGADQFAPDPAGIGPVDGVVHDHGRVGPAHDRIRPFLIAEASSCR